MGTFNFCSLAVVVVASIFVFYFDLRYFNIPNPIPICLFLAAVLLQLFFNNWQGVFSGIGAAAVVFCIFLIPYMFSVLGGGDVKLAASFACLLHGGFRPVLGMVMFIWLVGGLLGVIYLMFYHIRGGSSGAPKDMPYGPAICAGAFLSLMLISN